LFRPAVAVALALAVLVDPAASVVRKCFSCRSRGPLGDCRDPFYLSANATIIESKKSGVETPPCSSGWCRKVIEGRENRYKDADYGLATQRDCLARPPSDGKERCAYVKYNRKEVYMCFCKGDLCNGAPPSAAALGAALAAALCAVLLGHRH